MAVWQILRIFAVYWIFQVQLPMKWILIPPGIMILSNIWLSRRSTTAERPFRIATSSVIAGMFFSDTLCFTASLMLAVIFWLVASVTVRFFGLDLPVLAPSLAAARRTPGVGGRAVPEWRPGRVPAGRSRWA